MSNFHTPVLLNEAIEGLNICKNGTYVDATFGGGGHSKLIISKLLKGKLIGFDQDKAALVNSFDDDNRFIMINKNFKYLKEELLNLNIHSIDGLIADLGVSSHHFTDNQRGFSLKYDSKLDMRMDHDLEFDAAYILNNYNAKNLSRIFREHADFHSPNFIVKSIINHREKKLITTTFELKELFTASVSNKHENKFFARLFQAIRIEVNDELSALKELLNQALEILNPSGRLVVISYHSLEDKIVKNFMKFGHFLNSPVKDFFGNPSFSFKLINRKPIVPSYHEIKLNNRARSAKLRVCEKL
ncbi:MAG: 16S rRNA (cytosine(1402)-N(4))-methyltransferase [Flavobacteriales bacterium]|nr:16S rRNA (cytosine(1402)-N(4))-methyltransferase [Flavobacteriales bacterium]